MGEGLAPELFFCRWLQGAKFPERRVARGLFQNCLSTSVQLRIMVSRRQLSHQMSFEDHFVFEGSFKAAQTQNTL